MSFSYLNIELYYSAIENFHTFVYIYCMVRVTGEPLGRGPPSVSNDGRYRRLADRSVR